MPSPRRFPPPWTVEDIGARPNRCVSKVVAGYNRPFPPLSYQLRLAQRSFPLLSGVDHRALLRKDGVRNFEGFMCCAIETDCIAGSGKLLRSGLADRAKEGHGL
jgi:hypothetical protein